MRLLETILWLATCCVIGAIGIGKINEHIDSLNQLPTATRHAMIDGVMVPYWIDHHNGASVIVYQCPGEQPRLAAQTMQIQCTGETE